MEFSARIKYVRAFLGMTQEKLAGELKVSFTTLNRWERGKVNPSFLALSRFNSFCAKNCIKFDEDAF